MISVFKLPSVIVATGFPNKKTTYTHILCRVSNLKNRSRIKQFKFESELSKSGHYSRLKNKY